jgi:putative ABC transport system permease protein
MNNYLAAALGDLTRNKTYAVISVLGLAVGIAAALLMAVLLRNHYSYEHFMRGHRATYIMVTALLPAGRPPGYADTSNALVAGLLRARFSEVTASTRLASQEVKLRSSAGDLEETVYWADPNAFELLELPVHVGNLRSALARTDAIVLSRSKARKYFGTDTVIGRTLLLSGQHPMTVTAVIEDLPVNGTMLATDVFAAGHAAFSLLTQLDQDPGNRLATDSFSIDVRTYLRLAPHASLAKFNDAMPALLGEIWSERPSGLRATMQAIPVDREHLFEPLNPGIGSRLSIILVAGLVILFLACANFVNLTTARSARRALEVGIRKAVGAGRGAIMAQFLGEAALQVVLAMCLAMALTELVLPHVNAFLDAGATFEYWRDPLLIALLGGTTVLLTLIAGMYPAFVVSAFAPAQALRGVVIPQLRPNTLRHVLVILQFASLIALAIAAGVVQRQRLYAITAALRVDTDQVLVLETACDPTLRDELTRSAGVRAVGCANRALLDNAAFSYQRLPDGSQVALTRVLVGVDTFELLGLQPLAGRFFTRQRGDEQPEQQAREDSSSRCIVNEAAVRRFGWAAPAAAVGKTLPKGCEVIGVVADFSLSSVEERINPTSFHPAASGFNRMLVKLAGQNIPEVLAVIDQLWRATGSGEPVKRYFLDEYLQSHYVAILREAQALNVFVGVALLLACLGLFALSASITAQRSKEIGIRKAMGASALDILRFLMWQFSIPVMWAALLGCPIAAYVMNRWLSRFAYRIDLEPWLFVAAAAGALLVAGLTVAALCYRVARTKPSLVLRTE